MICLNFEGDSLEHFSVTPDGLDDRGALPLRNAPLALIVESGSAEVAEEPKETVGLMLFYHHTESVCACIRNQQEFLGPEIAAFKSGKAETLVLDKLLTFLGRCAIGAVRTRTWLLFIARS